MQSQNQSQCKITQSDSSSLIDNATYTASIDPAYLDGFEPVVFNIFFWVINNSNGTNTPTINE